MGPGYGTGRRSGFAILTALAAWLSLVAAVEAAPLSQAITALVPFATAPFPFDGIVPETGQPFLDVIAGGRRGHRSARGGVYWADETYADNRSLLFVPAGFDPRRPATIVVYFHGNESTLSRDVLGRQRVADQLARSGLNAVLLAPQFAFDAFDSSPGRFWLRGAFAAYLGEASDAFAGLLGEAALAGVFDRMPVVLVAYSGGYLAAARVATIGGAGPRLCGLVLFDAAYAEAPAFASWIFGRRGDGFFFSAYTASTEAGNIELQRLLSERGMPYGRGLAVRLLPGAVTFVGVGVEHRDFVTTAWRPDPLRWLLSEVAANGDCQW